MRGKWGGSHTAFDNLKSGWKLGELGKRGLKRVDKMGRELIRKGLIRSKPTHYGEQVSLEVRRRGEILDLIQRYFPDMVKPS